MKIQVHCDDGTDLNCHGTVETELPYPGLSESDVQVNWVTESGRELVESVHITPPDADWVKQHEHSLHPSEIDAINEDGAFDVEYSDLQHVVCSACGSDQTYDSEGNNTNHT